MRVVVIGAGEVGASIATALSDSHDVTVIDTDGELVEELAYSIDVLGVEGNGTSLGTLEQAGIADADIVIASTDDDETNIVACNVATVTSDAFTIARVKKPDLLKTWNHSPQAFGVDFMVCTDLMSAQEAVAIIGLPAARDVAMFANGLVQMAEFEVPPDSPIAELTVAEADQDDSLTFVGVFRNGSVEIARGTTTLHVADKVVVIGTPESVEEFATQLTPSSESAETDEVIIIGGTEIGFQIARLLENRGLSPRLIEEDNERARDIAEALPGTTVLQSDATDTEFLTREHIDDASVVIAALAHDEMNLLVSLLAKQLGVSRAIAVVEAGEYVSLFETVGVDVAINPRQLTAEEITRFTHERRTENIAMIENDLAEVIELEIETESALLGRPIRESMGELPDGVVIGAITRDGEYVTPRGNTVIEKRDHVILFVESSVLESVTAAV